MMREQHYYKEVDGLPVPCGIVEWGMHRKKHARVAKTVQGNIEVSTVFIGIDHNFMDPDGPPLVYETMVFNKGEDVDCMRSSTRAGAEDIHRAMCEKWLTTDS